MVKSYKQYKRIISSNNHDYYRSILYSDDEDYKKFAIIIRLKRIKYKVRFAGMRKRIYKGKGEVAVIVKECCVCRK